MKNKDIPSTQIDHKSNVTLYVNCIMREIGQKAQDCHPELPRAKEFRQLGLGRGAISVEESLFLVGLVNIVRPHVVLELGTETGASSLILGAACKDLSKGRVISIDRAITPPEKAVQLKEKYGLPIAYISADSLDFLNDGKFSSFNPDLQYLVFSDTDIKVRPKEVELARRYLPSGTVIAVHDTSNEHPFGPMNLIENLHASDQYIELPSPRGMTVIRTRKSE